MMRVGNVPIPITIMLWVMLFAALALVLESRESAATGNTTWVAHNNASSTVSKWWRRRRDPDDPNDPRHRDPDDPKDPRARGCWGRPWKCRQGQNPPFWKRCCRNRCVDVSIDVNNCGFCGIRCPFNWQCCFGFCRNINRNPLHCGKCFNRCPFLVPCRFGMCGYARSSPAALYSRPTGPNPQPFPTELPQGQFPPDSQHQPLPPDQLDGDRLPE